MVKEIVLAIDPALCKIEEILLWKNKFKSCAIFTFCHFLFWFFQNFNIRTYCTISCIFLVLHMLDAYRAKKKRELQRLQSNKNIVETLSSLGRFIIYFNAKLENIFNKINKLKRRNRLLYFLVMFLIWNVTLIIGFNVKGFYLSYIFFWIIFFVPAIIHFDLPRKILRRALPLLEQLDHSMKYERRSILDKKDLLVNVKLPNNDFDDEEEENEYLKSFQLTDMDKMKENDVGDDDDEDEDEDDNDEEEEEIIEEVYEIQNYMQFYKAQEGSKKTPEVLDKSNENQMNRDEDEDEDEYDMRFRRAKTSQTTVKKSNKYYAPIKPNNVNIELDDYDDDDSLLPNESMPSLNDVTDSFMNSSNDEAFYSNDQRRAGEKVLKRRLRNRPSLLDYYGEELKSEMTNKKEDFKLRNSSRRLQQNDQDIDDTFDFLEEELNKY